MSHGDNGSDYHKARRMVNGLCKWGSPICKSVQSDVWFHATFYNVSKYGSDPFAAPLLRRNWLTTQRKLWKNQCNNKRKSSSFWMCQITVCPVCLAALNSSFFFFDLAQWAVSTDLLAILRHFIQTQIVNDVPAKKSTLSLLVRCVNQAEFGQWVLPGSDQDRVAFHIQQFEVIRMRSVALETQDLLLT